MLKRHTKQCQQLVSPDRAFSISGRNRLDRAPPRPVRTDSDKGRNVTVCAACRRASCWHGEFLCDEAQNADIIGMTVAELDALGAENPEHYSVEKVAAVNGGTEKMNLSKTIEAAGELAKKLEAAYKERDGALEQIDDWKDASGLERGGDPDGVTPEGMRKYWEGVEAERDALRLELNHALAIKAAEGQAVAEAELEGARLERASLPLVSP